MIIARIGHLFKIRLVFQESGRGIRGNRPSPRPR